MAVTLFDVTLDLARTVRNVQEFTVDSITSASASSYTNPITGEVTTSGSTNKFSCSSMRNISGEYVGGTLWVKSGNSAGKFVHIKRAVNQFIEPQETTIELATGNRVAICPRNDFTLDDFIAAINSVLYKYPIIDIDTSLDWDSNTMAYTIPTGVSDIRRVQIENTNNDGTYTISHCWTEDRDGKLRFHTAQGLYADGGEIQILYRKMHGEIYNATDAVDPMVDLTYLRNMAFLYLWRNVIIEQHKDNPIAADMYNEAKLYESEHTKFNLPERNIMIRDFYTR